MSAAVRKGERVSVSGLRSNVNGQIVLAASSVTLNGHTFLSQPGPGPIADEERNAAPLPLRPPLGGPNRGRGPRGGPDMARLGPQGPGASGPVTPPPPPPSGPDLARPQGNQPPPPPPPDGNRMNAPTPPIDLNAPAQPNTAPAPPAGQPVAPTFTPPIPNGPNR